MKIIAQSGMKYIPKWNKNRKEPEETQIVIEWNYLSGVDRETIYGIKPIEFDVDTGTMQKTMQFKVDNIDLLKKSIKNIVNLDIDRQLPGEAVPATVDDICNLPELGGLYTELKTFFTEQNTETEKKN
jgi:hypothetical protein